MNFRFIDRYDHEIVPISNAPPDDGSGYGDVFSDRDLLAASAQDFLGGTGQFYRFFQYAEGGYRLEFFDVSEGEAAGRANFQKVALYHGSKASRKILGPPLASWPSWSAVSQPQPQSVVIHARASTENSEPLYAAGSYFRQSIPPAITATLCDTGSDLVFAGEWLNHQDTRTADNVTRTLVTSGYVWLSVAPHFAPVIIRDEQTEQLRHDWKNRAIFYLAFLIFYKEEPVVISPSPFLARGGQAGLRFRQFPIRASSSLPITLQLPATGLYSPEAVDGSQTHYMWSEIPYSSTFAQNASTGEISQTNWVSTNFSQYILSQSFYIAPN